VVAAGEFEPRAEVIYKYFSDLEKLLGVKKVLKKNVNKPKKGK
jgi:hypothetical protein